MSPRKVVWSALALAALSSAVGAAENELTFAFTCTVGEDNQPVCPKSGARCAFKNKSGTPVTFDLPYQLYEGASRPDPACGELKLGDFPEGTQCFQVTDLPNYICDYLRASGPPSGFETVFNSLPTLAAQKSAAIDEIASADTAYAAWFDFRIHADASKIPAATPDLEKWKKLSSMFNTAYVGLYTVAKPFLWPPSKQNSYINGEDRADPWTYADYIGNRPSPSQNASFPAIRSAMDAIEAKQVEAARRRVTSRLPSGMSFNDLNESFDGSLGSGAAPTPAVPGQTRPSGATPKPDSPLDLTATTPPPSPVTAGVTSDGSSGWSLLPKQMPTVAQLGIFSRGYSDGVQRLKDLSAMMIAHATGKTYTLGDPLDRAQNGLQQLAGSCGVGAQYQALAAHGKIVPMPTLARTAEDHGWYVEINNINDPNGQVGGTDFSNEGKLLALNGVANRVIQKTDAASLQKWLVTSPSHDAIVDVRAKILWNNPKIGDGVDHDIYISGVEINHASGQIVGYYINDTGTGEAGRYVPAETFNKAWGGDMVEIGATSNSPTPAVTTLRGAP